MANKYLYITLLALLGYQADTRGQEVRFDNVPRLVVGITIDHLRSDYLEAFAPLYGNGGLKLLLDGGLVYTNCNQPFTPVDRASAIASIYTGTTPYYNNISGVQWFNRETLRTTGCTDDVRYPGLLTSENAAPTAISCTTISDEIKIANSGQSLIYAIAPHRESAVLSGGHAADMALWYNAEHTNWCTSQYYTKNIPLWLKNFNHNNTQEKTATRVNTEVTELAKECLNSLIIGRDEATDMLCITYDAGEALTEWQQDAQQVYTQIDSDICRLISYVEAKVGAGKTIYFLTGTGVQPEVDTSMYEQYHIPTGTFYMNRAVNLLNMYLGALWGQGEYVEGAFRNQIYLNHKLLETRKIDIADALTRCQEIVAMMDGVSSVCTSLQLLTATNDHLMKMKQGFAAKHCGDLTVEVAPGWGITNEDTHTSEPATTAATLPFPIIFYGPGIPQQRITTPVTADRIAPTVARAIRIRAPNGCTSLPLF